MCTDLVHFTKNWICPVYEVFALQHAHIIVHGSYIVFMSTVSTDNWLSLFVLLSKILVSKDLFIETLSQMQIFPHQTQLPSLTAAVDIVR